MENTLLKSMTSKYHLPKLKTAREQNKQCSSIFHKQRRKYLISRVLSQKGTNRTANLHSLSKINAGCKNQSQNQSLSKILKNVKHQFHNQSHLALQKYGTRLLDERKIGKKQLKMKRLQKKVTTANLIISDFRSNYRQSQDVDTFSHYNQTLERKVHVRTLILENKPPQRHKTQIVAYQSSLILFGGIGCQKNLTWAKLGFNPQTLELAPKQDYHDQVKTITPYYGHTMKAYRNYAYIYGGFNGDTLNELIVMNLKTMNYKPTFLAPFRRKQHAATMVGRYMVIHGGIQRNQTKNNLFYYDTETRKWTILPCTNMPYLSHHSMVTIPVKNKRKVRNISQNHDVIYMFGGKNQRGESTNKLYKIKIVHDFQVSVEQVVLSEFSEPVPDKRYACCFEYAENGNILLYGGKQDSEAFDFNVKNGTFNDTYLFNIYKKTWKKQDASMDYRQSTASTSIGGKVYIYGGFGDTYYANGNLTIMKISQNGKAQILNEDDQECQKQNISCISSAKRIQCG